MRPHPIPHPIPPVSEPLQYRAIGVVRGTYVPTDPDQITRGQIQTGDGEQIEAVVLGRLLTLMRRHLDLSQPHLWVAYPRCREQGGLHLQLVGIWEPSTLASPPAIAEQGAVDQGAVDQGAVDQGAVDQGAQDDSSSADLPADALPEGDEYFSVRGELIFTKPETGDLVIKVRQLPRADGQRPAPFKLQLRGAIPLEHLRHFVAIDGRRQGQQLLVERFEVIAPVVQRGNRGGKGRRDGRGAGGSRQPQAVAPAGERAAAPARSAVTRPGR